MKKIKPKKVKQQKVVKVTPIKQTNVMKGSTKIPDISVSGMSLLDCGLFF